MKIHAVSSLKDVDARQWDLLWAHCPDATVFQTRQWMQAWADTFMNEDVCMKVVLATESGRLVGMAPLVLNLSQSARQWVILGSDYSDYQLFLALDNSPRIVSELLEGIDQCLPAGDAVMFGEIPQFSALSRQLQIRASASHVGVLATASTACPSLRIHPNPLGVSKVLGKSSLRRSERSIRLMGQVVVSHSQSASDIVPLLSGLYEQHVARWANTDYPSLFLKFGNRQFYRRVVDLLAPLDQLVFTTLHLDGKVIAQHFGLLSKDRLLWYKPTFDVQYKRYSPGNLLVKSLIQYACEKGLMELDFTRGDEAFKSRFSSVVRFNKTFVWYRSRTALLRASFLSGAKALRDRLRASEIKEPVQLGGAPSSGCGSGRALILDGQQQSSSDIIRQLVRKGVDVHVACSNRTKDMKSIGSLFHQPPASDLERFGRWISNLDRAHHYELIASANIHSMLALASFPETHAIRIKALLAPNESLKRCFDTGTIRSAAMTACEMAKSSKARGRVFCLYACGALIWFSLKCEKCEDDYMLCEKMVSCATGVLDRLSWHGAATVELECEKEGNPTVVQIFPFFDGELGLEATSGINFPLGLWQIARGFRTGPQPQLVRS